MHSRLSENVLIFLNAWVVVFREKIAGQECYLTRMGYPVRQDNHFAQGFNLGASNSAWHIVGAY